jgi:uncharacterized protein
VSRDGLLLSTSSLSLDGRTFSGELAPAAPVVPGDLVRVKIGDAVALGQVLQKTAEGRQSASCSGSILGQIAPDGGLRMHTTVPPFADAELTLAPTDDWEALQRAGDATLTVGEIRTPSGTVPARLRHGGFGRHTFLCGQSGSGKTFALGVILERLMVGTELRILILDPNSDYVRLNELRPDVPPAEAERLQAVDVNVLRPDGTNGKALRSRFAAMSLETKAAVLQLDPLADRDEYNALLHLPEDLRNRDAASIAAHLQDGTVADQTLGRRIENLGMLDWEIWARAADSLVEVIERGGRVTVLDLSGFHYPPEPLVATLDLLDYLWKTRERRVPTLLVIDEAHNVCSEQPVGSLQTATTNRLIQIAGEGRKYGLWLLLSTQRPSKIHTNVLSQCDNLALMRMNSPGDLAELGSVFGFAPASLLSASPSFQQGEMLLAGGFAVAPAVVRVGVRHTYEGGSDVRVPVAGADEGSTALKR